MLGVSFDSRGGVSANTGSNGGRHRFLDIGDQAEAIARILQTMGPIPILVEVAIFTFQGVDYVLRVPLRIGDAA